MPGEKETYKYLGILEADTIKQAEMKEKLKKSISWEPNNSRNLINTWVDPLVRHSGPFLK